MSDIRNYQEMAQMLIFDRSIPATAGGVLFMRRRVAYRLCKHQKKETTPEKEIG